MIWGAVALAGALGAATRYLVDHGLNARLSGVFPWGTLVVNVSGSLLAGVVTGLTTTQVLPPAIAVVAAGGFLGAYTTFSTAMYETARLLEDHAHAAALANLMVPLLSSAVAAAIGWSIATALLPQ